jgi:exosortase A
MPTDMRVALPQRDSASLRPVTAFAFACVVILLSLVLYMPTAKSMASIWSLSATYTHGWLVLPACFWFIWQRRDALATKPLRPWWPGLVFIAASGSIWLLGELSGSQAPSHFALVAMCIAATITATGLAWSRLIAFPLVFLFFAVPFGEALVPRLMDWTADFTVVALQFSGVPVFREGNDLTIPTGRWSVVEACSGVRYLLASLMAGTLYAWVMYRSPGRRLAFIVASLLVPIVANWLRAYLIVMLGHLSNNEIAAGVDHLVYGWLFFGVVIGALFWIGTRWREDSATPVLDQTPHAASVPAALVGAGLASVVAALAVWPMASAFMSAPVDERPVMAVAPDGEVSGWGPTVDGGAWQPALQAPRALLSRTYAQGDDRVRLHLGVFRAQAQGSELVSSGNTVAAEGSGWREVSRDVVETTIGDIAVKWRSVVVRNERGGGYERLWIAYWIGGAWTISDARAKADLAVDRVLRRSDTSAWVGLATPYHPDRPQSSERVLHGFIAAMGPALQRALEDTAAQ